jgi:hypothetical protein
MVLKKGCLRDAGTVVYLATIAAAPVVSIIKSPVPTVPGNLNQSSLPAWSNPLKKLSLRSPSTPNLALITGDVIWAEAPSERLTTNTQISRYVFISLVFKGTNLFRSN